mgnify:CR=1 FL=1
MLWQRRDEKPAMDLRRLCCAGLCACGAALVVLEVPSLRFMLASQAGLAAGWRIAAMPPNILAHPCIAAGLCRLLGRLHLGHQAHWAVLAVAQLLLQARASGI